MSEELPKHMTWQMWLKLLEVRLRFVLLLIATALLIGYWDTMTNYWERATRSANPREIIAASAIEYFCPMDPQIVRDEMGNCPICGMPLSKRAKGIAAPLPPEITGRLTLTPYRIALAGIRTVKIGYEPLVRKITTYGEVVYDERKFSRISARFAGRIETIEADFTGRGVKTGESLLELYSPSLITTFDELVSSLKSDASGGYTGISSTAAIRKKLLFWGVDSDQIEAVLKNASSPERLIVRSTMSGIVIKKYVVEGQYVEEGMPLFDLGNLNIVWVNCKVYEDDLPFAKVGQLVKFESVSFPSEEFTGRVVWIDPALDRDTRTANVRVDMVNTSTRLKPGMFGTARIEIPLSQLDTFREAVQPNATGSRTVYWCPMHPEVQQDKPGVCDKCGGMALIAKTISDTAEETLSYVCPMHPEGIFDKPGKCLLCKPYMDMDLDPVIKSPTPCGILSVPESAVIDTGLRKVVYVDIGSGTFEGRQVRLGARTGTRYPVFSGLHEGDAVAMNGAFLIDAETRLNPAAGAAITGRIDTEKQAASQSQVQSQVQPQVQPQSQTIQNSSSDPKPQTEKQH
ncbi:MAG: efflux RND transporter periplasmic adaptor subunit [Candidatus Riflebacteria bacterium]|nr:efflux RND transporter periplasmic adaptor subunit [Candidatus Riflebacteria bacterium]